MGTSPLEFEGGGARLGGGLGGGASYNPPRITPPSAPPARPFIPPANQSTGGGYGGSKLGQPGSQSTKNFPPLNAPLSPPKPPSGPSNFTPPPAKPPTPPTKPPTPPTGQLPPPKAPPPPPGGNNPSPPGSYDPPGSEEIQPPGTPPFNGGQMPGELYFVYLKYGNTNVHDGRVITGNQIGPFEAYGPINSLSVPNANNPSAQKVFEIVDTVGGASRKREFSIIGVGWTVQVNGTLIQRQNGQPDTGGNPPGGEPPIRTEPPIKPAQFAGELGDPPTPLSPPPFEAFKDSTDGPDRDPYTGPFQGISPMAFSPLPPLTNNPFSPNAPSPLGGDSPTEQKQPNNNLDLGPFTKSTSYTDSGTSTSPTTSSDTATSTSTKTDTKTESTFEDFLKALSPTALLIPPLMSPANPLNPSANPQNFTFPNNNPAPQSNTSPPPVQQTAPPSSCETSNACVVGPMKNLQAGQNSLLDKVNAGLNALDMATNLAMLNVINNKLGPQMNGGISGALGRAWKAAHMDKALNALNTALLLHNAAMLSKNLAITLGDVTSTVLNAFGVKDEDNQPLDVNQVIGKKITELAKAVLGAEVYDDLSDKWKAASRILASASRMLDIMRSMIYSMINGLEVIGRWIALIGNGAQKDGLFSDGVFPWANENPNFKNPFFNYVEKLERLEDAASSINELASEVVEGKELIEEFRKEKKTFNEELDKGAKELSDKEEEEIKKSKNPDLIKDEDLSEAPEED